MRCWKIFASIFLCCSDPPKLSLSGSQPVMSTKSDLNEQFLIENSKRSFLKIKEKKKCFFYWTIENKKHLIKEFETYLNPSAINSRTTIYRHNVLDPGGDHLNRPVNMFCRFPLGLFCCLTNV